jgi:large subunit ribosomal protein L29
MMKAASWRERSVSELREEVNELQEQLVRLRFRKATGQLENPHKIPQVRKDLARVKTVLTEKEAARR